MDKHSPRYLSAQYAAPEFSSQCPVARTVGPMASAIVPGTAIAIPASGIEEAEPNAGDTQESAEAAQEAQCEDACAQKAFNDAAQAERDARDVYGKILPHETTGLNYSERIASATQDKIKAQNAMDLYWNELAAQEEALKAARDNLANAQAFLF